MTDTTTTPRAPGHLQAKSRRLWDQTVAAYELEPHELETLRLALEAMDRAATARNALKRHGMTYNDRFGAPHVRPEVAIAKDATAQYAQLMRQLDLPAEDEGQGQGRSLRGRFAERTPSGRGRIAQAKAPTPLQVVS